MKQVFAKKGTVEVEDVPLPTCADNEVKVKVYFSAISVGTELGTVKKVKQPLYKTALEKRDMLDKVIKKARNEGYIKTYSYIKQLLDTWWPLGYSCVGQIIEIGKNVTNISINDFVACGGQDFASHAEVVCVPKNLVVLIPQGVNLKEASFTTIGAIAINGIRRLNLTFGETVVVYGLGLIGQIVSQLLNAVGCNVIGVDIDENRAKTANLSKFFTPKNIVNSLSTYNNGLGVDGVIITAASKDETIINNALRICRNRGRIVLIGKIPLKFDLEVMYKKEIDILSAISYGPGRHDPNYEERGQDYPLPYVRWTINRNMQEFLELLRQRKIKISHLIDKEISIDNADKAYNLLSSSKDKPLSVIITYPKIFTSKDQINNNLMSLNSKSVKGRVNVALIGVGNFAKATHLPNIKSIKAFNLKAIITKNPGNAKNLAVKNDAEFFSTNYRSILKTSKVDAFIISTRNSSHAFIAMDALNAGKHVLVEKPMGVTRGECLNVLKVAKKSKLVCMVGFNRNYAPFTKTIKKFLSNREYPLIINYRVNTKFTLNNDRENFLEEGGSRVVNEMCHMFSFFNFLIESHIIDVKATKITTGGKTNDNNNVVATIKYRDGSIANLVYTNYANDSLPKERIEIFGGGNFIIVDDFTLLNINGDSTKINQDKGHYNELLEFANRIKNKDLNVSYIERDFESMDVCFKVMDCLSGRSNFVNNE